MSEQKHKEMKTKLHTSNTYSTNRTLESVIWISAIILFFILFSYTNAFANPTNFKDESYIDDIPFNTTEIYNEIITEQQLAEFTFEEEEYINDIPFDTKSISAECLYRRAISVEFSLEEEQFINDIEL